MCNRSRPPRAIVICFAIFLASCERDEHSSPEQKAQGPSVLLITLDTTRADRIGAYGHEEASTPTIDKLAESGVLFKHAHCQVPLTLPSHASLMTGTYPVTNGVPVNGVALGTGVTTLAETFQKHGYRTGAFISALVMDSRYGLDRGFDEFNDNLGSTTVFERPANQTTDAALGWLSGVNEKPSFTWVHYFDPHSPHTPPAEFREKIEDPYDGEIAFVDSQIHRLVDWLEKNSMRSNTLIVIAGDHGEAFGEHGETEHGFFIYNTTTHVPLILSFPDYVTEGKTIETPVGLVDVFSTIVELLDWKDPDGLEGKSMVKLWQTDQAEHHPVYTESEYPRLGFGWAPLFSIIAGQWKFIDAPRGELFDRSKDPEEKTNAIEQNPMMASDLDAQLQAMKAKMIRRTKSTVASAASAVNDLEALGYVGGAASAVDSENSNPTARDPKDMVGVYEAHSKTVGALLAKRYAQVIETMTRLVRESPESDEFYNTLGRALLETGRYAEAQKAFEMSLRQSRTNPRRLWRLGDSLLRQKKVGDATAALKASLAIAPQFAEAHCSLGDAFASSGKEDQALKHFQLAVDASPDLARAHGRLGVALAKKKQFNEAIVHLRRYTELEPNSPHALTNLGNVLFQTKNLSDAVKFYERALQIDPRYTSAHMSLFRALLLSGKQREGILALKEARKAIPRSVDLTSRLAWLLATTTEDLQDPKEALDLAQRVVRARTPTSEDLATLAAAQAANGNFDAAIHSATQALSLANARQDTRASQRIRQQIQHYQAATLYRE